jgi:hypothetical protein
VLPKPQPQIPEAKPPKANVEHGLGVLDAALDSATQKCLVYLVGPMPGQFQEIKHRCAGMKRVQLVFLDKDKSPYVPRTAKHVLLTQHTPHKWWDAARSAAGADNVKFIHGGINAVCDAVAEIYRNLEKTTK